MERVALLALVLPAVLAGCLAGASPPQVATGQIDGAVVDHLLRPFANQTVYVSQLGWRDSTSPLGGFTFRHIPVGSYTLLAAHEGTRGAVATVDVQENHITKVILQMMPVPELQPSMDMVPHSARADFTQPGLACNECTWTVPVDGFRLAEVTLESHWNEAAPLGRDQMRFAVHDDRGDLLYVSSQPMSSPLYLSIAGADVPADAHTLTVTAWYSAQYTPQANFRMDSVMTFYHGATRSQLFQS
jgi:hypothetical protein